ncbi:MAG: Rne/Rng family ribonuclease [Verrucomicrobia bacterium]|nr:MAG: Rne/Rng family ribonuclease [Verrucomicrobiota bacterium]
MSHQSFKRGRGSVHFKPTRGLGTPRSAHGTPKGQSDAIGARMSNDRVYDTRRHEAEVRRAENLAAGLPEDAPDADEAPNLTASGRDQSYRSPDRGHHHHHHDDDDAHDIHELAPGAAPAQPSGGQREGRGRGGRGREVRGGRDGGRENAREGGRENREGREPREGRDRAETRAPEPRGLIEKAKAAVKDVVKKVRNLIQPEPKTVKEVIINAEPLETRVAVLEDGRLEDFTVERTNDPRLVGSIFKGKVKNLEDNLKAAFVDIGFEKNAFLHYWDIVPNSFDSGVEIIERTDDAKRKKDNKQKITQRDVPRLYPPGSEIIVQVTKDAIGTKGPRVTTNLALPGRYLVLLPNSDQSGISRKIESLEERQRLKKIVRELKIPEGMGVIIRTAGEGRLRRYFIRDLAMLLGEWHKIEEAIKTQPPATCVFQEPDLIERTVRDFLTEDVTRIVIDDGKKHEHIADLIHRISPRSAKKVHFYNEAEPLFDRFNISRQLETAFSRQVPLKSGGYLVIDETEALVAIDVNTGKHKGGKDHDSAIVKVNIEAADEICRQLRLRNMGGIIVLDFIDMRPRKDQLAVFQRVKDGLRRDKAKTHVLPLSQLGLMEMTRQRQTESVQSSLYEDCSGCRGRGFIKSAETMSVEIQRKLTSILKARPRDESDFQVKIVCNPKVLERLRTRDEQLLIDLEKKFFAKLSFRPDGSFHNEQWIIYNALTNEEIARSKDQHTHA